jgi:hypothetical protein
VYAWCMRGERGNLQNGILLPKESATMPCAKMTRNKLNGGIYRVQDMMMRDDGYYKCGVMSRETN